MSSTCDRGVVRLAYKVRNMPKHFFIRRQQWFFLMSVWASLRLYVTRNQRALIFGSVEQKTSTSSRVEAAETVQNPPWVQNQATTVHNHDHNQDLLNHFLILLKWPIICTWNRVLALINMENYDELDYRIAPFSSCFGLLSLAPFKPAKVLIGSVQWHFYKRLSAW